MVQLEITLTGRSKSFTADTLQNCANNFLMNMEKQVKRWLNAILLKQMILHNLCQ